MSTEPEHRPTLVLNPPDDDDFRSFAIGLVEGGVNEPSALERELRDRYPAALVRPRGLAGEPTEIWYVYRDGRWVRRTPKHKEP